MPFSHIPTEIIAHILSYCEWALFICHQWHQLVASSHEYRRCYKAVSAPLSFQSRNNLVLSHVNKLGVDLQDKLHDVNIAGVQVYVSKSGSVVYIITIKNVCIKINSLMASTSDTYNRPCVTMTTTYYYKIPMSYDNFLSGEWIEKEPLYQAEFHKLIARLRKIDLINI